MKKILLFLMFALFCIPWAVNAQTTITLNGNLTQALALGTTYNFYDSGGEDDSYSTSETYTATFTFSGAIIINFSQFATESSSSCNNWDYMLIYDGDAATGTLLARGQTGCSSATLTTGTDIVAESGTMTVEWHSDGSTVAAGWVATITCEEINCPKPTEFAVSNVAAHSVTLSWVCDTDYPFDLDYGLDETYANSVDNWEEQSYDLTGLSANTTYYVRVQTDCDMDLSSWSYVTFTTPCEAIDALDYSENFDNATAGAGILPNCWREINTCTYSSYSAANYPRVYANSSYSTYASSSPNCLYLYSYYSSSYDCDPQPQYAILPPMNGLAGLQVALKAKGNNSTSTFKIGTMSDPTNASTFTPITEQALTTSYQEFEYIVPANCTDSYLAIMIDAASSSRIANGVCIDDIAITEAPSCLKPTNLAVDENSITSSGATITWTPGGDETEWEIEYSTNADFTNPLYQTVSTTPTYTFTVDPATTYYVHVRANCGGNDVSDYSNTLSFTTLCAAQNIPYTYDFETVDKFACWTPIAGAAIANSTSDAHESSYYLKFSGTTSNTIVLPQFTAPTNTLRVEFWTRPESTGGSSGKFAIGYMTDISDASTFVAVETYNSTEMTTSYVKKTVDFVSVPANANIAMRQFDCATYYYWYVDDVTVKEIPSCVAPTGLAATATTTSAELSWTANSGETSWKVYYKKTSDENYTEVANVTTNPYTLNGLTAATSYQYYVVANCSAADASEASDVFTFVTECEVIAALGYSENFDGYTVADNYTAPSERVLPTCWSAINTTTNSTYKQLPSIYYYSYTNYANSTPNCLKFYSFYSSYSDYDPQPQYAIMPEMTGLAGMQVTLMARGFSTTSTFKIGTMTDPADASTFVAITEQALTTSYQEFEYVIPASASGNYLAIMIDAASSDRTTNGVYIDNISIDNAPTCTKPTALECTATTTTTATLSWTNGAEDQTAWQICLNGDETNLITANSNPFTVGGLTASTNYTAKVRAYCGADDQSDWSNEASFTTECDAVTTFPWTENFNSLTAGIPACWDNSEGTTTSAAYKWNYYSTGHDGAGLRFDSYVNSSGNTNFLKTPTLSLPAGEEMQLTFWYKNPTGGDFSVYISTDGGATHETALVIGLTGVSAWTELAPINLSAYAGQDVVIVFKGTSNYGSGDAYLYLDDVTVAEAPACPKPTSLAVTPNSVTAHGATVTWTPGAEETNWIVQYAIDANFTDVLEEVVNTEPTYTFQGLNPVTTYYVRVKADCGPGIVSQTGNVVNFTTAVACPVPTNLTTPVVSGHYARLNWNENGTATNWVVAYKATADEEFVEEEVSETYYYFENLQPLTEYTVKVKAVCGVIDGESDWSTTKTFTTLEACPAPQGLSASAIAGESTQYKLDWYAGEATSWVLQYSTDNTFATVQTVNVPNIPPTATLTGLTPATVYYARVKGDCGDDGESAWSNYVSFTTPCDAYDIPYTYDFETVDKFACWTPIAGAAIANSTSYASYAHESSYYLKFSGTTSNMIALPQFTAPTNTLRVEFWTRPESTGGNSGKFAIGYMTDITNASTFVAVDTYNSTEMTTSYVKKTVDFNNAPAGAIIAMRQFDCSASWYWFVDDVTVKEIPSCQSPTGLAATATSNSANLSWTANSEETAWTVYYKKSSEESYTEVAVTTNSYTLEGLTAATAYEYYVVANCSETDASEASDVYEFTTECDAVTTFPWTENFESMTESTVPQCWDNSASTSSTLSSNPERIWGVYTNNGNNMLRMYNYYVQSGTALINSPNLTLPAEGVYQLTFDYSNLANCGAFTVKISEDGGTTFTDLQSYAAAGSTDYTDPGTFTEAEPIILADYAGKTVMLQFFANANYGSGAIFVDNIVVEEAPSCVKPNGLAATATSNSANLSWTANSEETAWTVYYKKSSEESYTEVDVTTNPYTLEGLTAATAYEYYVVANCSETEQSEASAVYEFTTGCEVHTLPYTYGFEDAGEFSCWTMESCHASTGISSSAMMNGVNGFSFRYNTNPPQYLISPEFEGTTAMDVSFYYKNYGESYPETFQVGYSTTDNAVGSFTWGDEITANDNTTWKLYEASFPAGTKYVAVKLTSNDQFYLYLDDFTFQLPCGGIVLNESNPTWSENFDNITESTTPKTGVSPRCWSWINLVTVDVPDTVVPIDTVPFLYYGADRAHSGSYSLRSHFRGINVMPVLDEESVDIQQVKLGFWVKQPHWFYPMQVGVMTDPEDASTFVPVAYVDNGHSTDYRYYEINFAGYTGEGRYIAFKHIVPDATSRDIHSVNFIDDITLSLIQEGECTMEWPYTENFDDLETAPLSCWELVNAEVTMRDDKLPMVYNEGTNYSLQMADRCVYALPLLPEDVEVTSLQLSMDVRQPNMTYQLEVGVWDGTTFEPVALVNNSVTDYVPFSCDFSRYAGEGRRIAFRNTLNNGVSYNYSYNYIDNIELTTVAACAGPVTLPYEQDFESFALSTEPTCWELVDENIVTMRYDKYPQVCSDGGDKCLRLADRCVYALPEIPSTNSVSELTLELTVRQPNVTYQLEVGVWDGTTFESVALVNNSDLSEAEASVDFSGYAGEGRRIALRNTLNNGVTYSYSYNYIDKINLHVTGTKSMASGSDEMDAAAMDSYLNNIAVYPNPTTGVLHIDAMDVQKVECYSQMGQLVGVYDNVNELNISELSNGVYMLRITVPQGVTMRKVVKR